MAGGYSVLNALNNSTKQQAIEKPQGRFRTKDISITDIYANDRNFYGMQDIEELAEDIKAVGLLENLNVCYAPANGRNYKLIGGERRWRALNLLLQQGYKEFAVATCQVRQTDNQDAETVEIIMCNRQRIKTVWEQIEEEKQLKQALEAMKANGQELKGYNLQEGRLRDTIARILGYSAAKVGQIETIQKHLIKEFSEALREEKINFSAAYTMARMPQEVQRELLKSYQENGSITSAEARQQATPTEPDERTEKNGAAAPDPVSSEELGATQKNVESICYHCDNYSDCYNKSSTTTECSTYRNGEEERKRKEKQEQKEQQEAAAAKMRIVDTETGEIYESMEEATKASQEAAEEPGEPKERVLYLQIAKSTFKEIESGARGYIITTAKGYKAGDAVLLQAFEGGRFTGETIKKTVGTVDDESTSGAIKEKYCILGFRA